MLFWWTDRSAVPVIPVISVRRTRVAPLTAPCMIGRSRSLKMPAGGELAGELTFTPLIGSPPAGDNNILNVIALMSGANQRLGRYLQTISWNMTGMRFLDF